MARMTRRTALVGLVGGRAGRLLGDKTPPPAPAAPAATSPSPTPAAPTKAAGQGRHPAPVAADR